MVEENAGQPGLWQTTSVLLIGVVSGFVLALQPMLLNGMARLGRISIAEMGYAAMFEAAGMAITVGCASLFLKPNHLRRITAAALLCALLVNIAALVLSNGAFVASRIVSGVAGGALLWVWVGLLARAELPGRLIGIYVAVQSVSLLTMSSLLSSTTIGLEPGTAGYIILASMFALSLLLLPLVPGRYRELNFGARPGMPSFTGMCGLIASALYLAAVMALWIYVLPVARALGFSDATGGLAISIALGLQIPAALAATFLASKLPPLPVFLGSIIINFIAVGIAVTTGSSAMFIAAIGLFGFLWIFSPPFHMPYLIQIDPSRRAALQLVTAQLVGSAVGPAVASAAVESEGVAAAAVASGVMFIGAALAIAVAAVANRRFGLVAVES